MTNSELLKKAIKESGMKISAMLDATGIKSYATLRAKINNQSEFTAAEIMTLCDLLSLDRSDREAIFFASDAESYSA